jgi:hypothetical protein
VRAALVVAAALGLAATAAGTAPMSRDRSYRF